MRFVELVAGFVGLVAGFVDFAPKKRVHDFAFGLALVVACFGRFPDTINPRIWLCSSTALDGNVVVRN